MQAYNTPDLGLGGHVCEVFLRKGVVQGAKIKVARANAKALRELLVARYGPPMSSESIEYKSGYGATFTGEEAFWHGARVVMKFRSLAGTVDTADVVFLTTAHISEQQRQRVTPAEAKDRL